MNSEDKKKYERKMILKMFKKFNIKLCNYGHYAETDDSFENKPRSIEVS